MKTRFYFKTIRGRLVTWFLLLSLIPLFIVSGITYTQEIKRIKNHEIKKLRAIRDLKANTITNWLDERIIDLKTLKK
ncbi:MAG: hypothetical protein HQK84_06355 [Nitrospinae bacterium]|nr:hypothetical protein [Nitrospinota bacterium]